MPPLDTGVDSAAVGVFWGNDEGQLPGIPSRTKKHTLAQQKHPHVTHSRLPDLHCAPKAELIQKPVEFSKQGHSTASLLVVLETLWKAIAKDTIKFTDNIINGKSPSVADTKYLRQRYYSDAVFQEDSKYFLQERDVKLQQETIHARTEWARQLHCATEDKQTYNFDRRRKHQKERKRNRRKSARSEQKFVEDKLIDRHDHKIQHLLHVLQEEIAAETKREIQFLDLWHPNRAISRQSRQRLSTIVKERYEAADRIMRILEEYHIVIGVEAAAYLQQTIADGKALSQQKHT